MRSEAFKLQHRYSYKIRNEEIKSTIFLIDLSQRSYNYFPAIDSAEICALIKRRLSSLVVNKYIKH